MSPLATLNDPSSSGSSEQRGAQKKSHTWGSGQRLGGPLKSASTPETAHEATPYQDQQNGSERLANLPSESHLPGSVKFGDNNTNCGNTVDSYNRTTNKNTTNNNTNTINNSGKYTFGGGVNNTVSGFTINEGLADSKGVTP